MITIINYIIGLLFILFVTTSILLTFYFLTMALFTKTSGRAGNKRLSADIIIKKIIIFSMLFSFISATVIGIYREYQCRTGGINCSTGGAQDDDYDPLFHPAFPEKKYEN